MHQLIKVARRVATQKRKRQNERGAAATALSRVYSADRPLLWARRRFLLTSSPPSAFGRRAERGKDGDSFCKTATFRRENVHCRIDGAMMIRAALRAGPFSYSKTFPALRAGAPVTAAEGLGCISFIDLIEPHAGVIALNTAAWSGTYSSPRRARISPSVSSRALKRSHCR